MPKPPFVSSTLPVPNKPLNDLDPPIFANPVFDVVGADIGLGRRHVEPYLLVTLSRWTSLSVGDTFEFYARDRVTPLASDFVKPGEQGQSFFRLAIEAERVPEDFVFPAYTRVLRNGSGTPSVSDEQTLLIKPDIPGGPEQPGLGYNDKLALSLPDDLSAPGAVLTPERAALGVVMTVDYPNKRVRDKVYLYWDTILQLVVLELDDDHASGAKPIEVFVGPEIIGTGSGLIAVRFQAFDEVGNRSGYVEHFSKSVYVQVELDSSLLERPYFQVNFDDRTDVNYDVEADSNFRVEVVTPRFLPDGTATPVGSRIVVTLDGTRADNSTVKTELPEAVANIGRSSFFNVDKDILKELIQGSMKITWRLEFPSGTLLATSQSLNVLINGTLAHMPAVTVLQAEAGLIDPDELYITIEYPDYIPHHEDNLVTLRMETILPGGGVISYERSHLAGPLPPPIRFLTVTRANFERFIGQGDVRIFYCVDDGVIGLLDAGVQTIRESDSIIVRFGLRVADMPRPEIQGVDANDNLDPSDVIGQLEITLPYAMTRAGDRLEWRFIGTDPSGSTNGHILLNGATAGRAVSFFLDRRYADLNVDGVIRLSYSLIPADGGRPLHSEVLVVTVGRALGVLLRPEVLEAQRNPDRLQAEAALDGATIRVTTPQILPSDQIRACFTGGSGVATYCDTQNGNTFKTVDFDVPAETIGANITSGPRFISVQYWLIRGGRATPSLELVLQMLPPAFQEPVIQGHSGTTLNTGSLVGTEEVMVNPWHFAHRLQRVWLEYLGENPDGSLYSRVLLNGELVGPDGETGGISTPALVSELRGLKEGSTLEIGFWVSFDRDNDQSQALKFPLRTYTIERLVAVTPTLTVRDSKGLVANGGTTYDTSVTLSGKATPNQTVQLYVNGVTFIQRSVNANGDWSYTHSGLTVRSYAYRVVGLYGNNPSSGTTTIHKAAAFAFDTTAVTRNQRLYLWRDDLSYRPHSGPFYFTRVASGGRTPYTYRSNNTSCAVVEQGVVYITGNGSAYITATDANNVTLGFWVYVSNVVYFMDYGGGGGYKESGSQASSRGGRLPSLSELRDIYSMYGGASYRGQKHQAFWSTDSAGVLARWGKNLYTGGEVSGSELGNGLTLVIF